MKSNVQVQTIFSARKVPGAWITLAILASIPPLGCGAGKDGPTAPVTLSWDEYKQASTRYVDGKPIYVVEWDLPLTEQQLRERYDEYAHFVEVVPGAKIQSIVNRIGNADDVWPNNQQMGLTYCVSDTFGANKARAVSEVAQAAAAWNADVNVTFTYVSSQDSNCNGTNTNVSFAVAPWTSSGACSFFPSAGSGCVPRTLVINFTDLDTNPFYQQNAPNVTTVGVFRHELGHIMGLRHEHTRPESGTCFEDNNWRALSTYDKSSLMHYPWCNGVLTSDLSITPLDELGVRLLYGGDLASPASIEGASGYVREDAVNAVVYSDALSNHIRELSFGGAGWSGADLSAITGGPLAHTETSAYIRADRVSAVVYRSFSDDHIRELSLVGSTWTGTDLTALAGGPAGSSPAGYRRSDGVSAVVYLGSDDHIYELALTSSGWQAGDLSAAAGVGLTAGAPVGYVRSDRLNAVVYLDTPTGDIMELALTGSGWVASDLTTITGAPAAAGNPTAYVRSDNVSAVVYRSTANHICELALTPGVGWSAGDLTAATGAPSAQYEPGAYVRGDYVNTVVYESTDAHIQELALTGSGWVVNDLTAITGAPTASLCRPTAFLRSDDVNSIVYTSDTDNDLHELFVNSTGGTWATRDMGR